jgi:23S rRNA pseudouridine2605 synthase
MQEPQKVRINKLLSQAGVASRREAEKLIHAGSVILNGKTVTEPGQTMLPGTDHLTVEGRKVRFRQAPKTKVYALYKPRNCITSLNDPEGRRTVKDFFPRDAGRLFPVGRLDYDA